MVRKCNRRIVEDFSSSPASVGYINTTFKCQINSRESSDYRLDLNLVKKGKAHLTVLYCRKEPK